MHIINQCSVYGYGQTMIHKKMRGTLPALLKKTLRKGDIEAFWLMAQVTGTLSGTAGKKCVNENEQSSPESWIWSTLDREAIFLSQ